MDMTVHTCGSSVDTVLGIYVLKKGLLGSLLASNDDTPLCPDASSMATSLLTFTFHTGIPYMIVVDSKPMASGQIQLSLTQGGKCHPPLCVWYHSLFIPRPFLLVVIGLGTRLQPRLLTFVAADLLSTWQARARALLSLLTFS